MTNERRNMASDVDETVRRTYREIAREQVPDHLNRAILEQAARAARPRYARSRAWTRPLAWAATIALSVAVVLEINRTPVPDDALDLIPPAMLEAESYEQPELPVATPEEAVPASKDPGRAANVTPSSPAKTGLMQKTATPLPDAPIVEERKREASDSATSTLETGPASASPIGLRDEDALRRADDMSKIQSGPGKESFAAFGDPGRTRAAAPASDVDGCPAEVTRDPSEWFECIQALETAGLDEQAQEQRRRLLEAFPGYEFP